MGLQDNKFYISRSSNLIKDIRKHLYASKAKWTTKYPPVDLRELIEIPNLETNNLELHKNQIILDYMSKFGWKNVRGGNWNSDNDEIIKRLLEKKHPEILKATNHHLSSEKNLK